MQSPFRLAKRVFSLNFKANLYVIIVVLGLVVALPRAFIHSGGDPERFLSEFMPYMIFAAAVLLYVLLSVVQVEEVLRRGVRMKGRLVTVQKSDLRVVIRYTFTDGLDIFERNETFNRTTASEKLEAGDAVTLMVHPTRHKRAYILELYE